MFYSTQLGHTDGRHGKRMNAAGVIAQQRKDKTDGSCNQGNTLHYCGRVGIPYANGCGECDGTCGPDSGCQCEDCYVLDYPNGGDEDEESSSSSSSSSDDE